MILRIFQIVPWQVKQLQYGQITYEYYYQTLNALPSLHQTQSIPINSISQNFPKIDNASMQGFVTQNRSPYTVPLLGLLVLGVYVSFGISKQHKKGLSLWIYYLVKTEVLAQYLVQPSLQCKSKLGLGSIYVSNAKYDAQLVSTCNCYLNNIHNMILPLLVILGWFFTYLVKMQILLIRQGTFAINDSLRS